jgi:hypothetical protein
MYATLCSACRCRSFEFVIPVAGPATVSTEEICALGLPGFPERTHCDAYVPCQRYVPIPERTPRRQLNISFSNLVKS